MSGAVSEAGSATTSVPVASGWDTRLLKTGGHLLQSAPWGELKRLHGWEVERVEVAAPDGAWRGMAQVLFRHRGPVSLGYVPRGPALDGNRQRGFRELTVALDRVGRERRALSIILEPDGPLALFGRFRDYGFVRGPAPFQPGRTVKVPLGDDAAILAQMHAKSRYNVRTALKRGVAVRPGGADPPSVDAFYGLLADTAGRNAFGIHDRAYYADFMGLFGERALMLFATVDGNIAAGLVAARFGDEAVYMYGGSSTVHRAHGAAFLLQYEAMRWARDAGCVRYDLWGIPAQDPPPLPPGVTGVEGSHGDDWRGLYLFKTRFGGEIVAYPPTMERRYRPLLATVARRVARFGG